MSSTANTVEGEPVTAPPRRGFRSDVWHVRRDPWAFAGAIVVVVFVLAAIFAPLLTGITGQNPYTYHSALDDTGSPKGWGGGICSTHWFGVEPLTGRDLFSIVVYGARLSLGVGIWRPFAVLIGVLVGVTTGYFGGWYDRIMSRVMDVMFGFPGLVFLIALTAIVPPHIPKPVFMILVIGFFGWPAVARVIRGQALSLGERTFVMASNAMGAGPWRSRASAAECHGHDHRLHDDHGAVDDRD